MSHKIIKVLPIILAILALPACRSTPKETQSEMKMDVGLNPAGVDVTKVRSFIQTISDIQKVGQGTLDPQVIFDFFPLTDLERSQLGSIQDKPVPVTCVAKFCIVKATPKKLWDGSIKSVKVLLSQIYVTGFGNPTIWGSSDLKIEMLVHSLEKIELCRVTGVQIYNGLWVRLDGALLDTKNSIYTVDLGTFGTYPKNCRP